MATPQAAGYSQSLNFQDGLLTTNTAGKPSSVQAAVSGYSNWRRFWADSDIEIQGDPDAQEAIRAELFYLAGSASPKFSIPPFGLSSSGYNGHIFWDADTWMLPALIPQHPQLARGIVLYRFQRLAQAKANALAHGIVLYRFQRLAQAKANALAHHDSGAEYPWESADTGREEAPVEFSRERHITADVALSAWQYYLWTGDKTYLRTQGWPVIQACAQYWAHKAKKAQDGSYHVLRVIGPDETSGLVDDDAYTNAAAVQCLRAADSAAAALSLPSDPLWKTIRVRMVLPRDPRTGSLIEFDGATDILKAKQADTELLLYPLDIPMPRAKAVSLLGYARQHTITVGPAMTGSIDALIAARLGLAQQSLDLYRASYQPFMRDPWEAFSEKRTRSNVYFCTGMGGCLQTVLYGFAGLNIAAQGSPGHGSLVARLGDAALFADPHLPPGWSNIIVRGVKFRGREFDIAISSGNHLKIKERSTHQSPV